MTMPIRQSLTVIVGVKDNEACAAELNRHARALAVGWSRVARLRTACVALLPTVAGETGAAESRAIFLECGFEGELSDLLRSLWRSLGPELACVLAHCDGYAAGHDSAVFAAFLRAQARRASPLFLEPPPSNAEEPPQRVVWRRTRAVFLAARLAWPSGGGRGAPLTPEERERRDAALGWQESEPGVPLLHAAELARLPGASTRVKRALRALDLGSAAGAEPSARLMMHGKRVVLLAYPSDSAAQLSERISQSRLAELARIWENTLDLPYCGGLLRRSQRARRLERFLLGQRVPVAAWFNAAHIR